MEFMSIIQHYTDRFSKLLPFLIKSPVDKSLYSNLGILLKLISKSKDNSITLYLYLAVDCHGKTVDFLLTKRRYMQDACQFFKNVINKHAYPIKVTLDRKGQFDFIRSKDYIRSLYQLVD